MVRKEPGNQQARMFLFQLLCLTGEWTKARAQLNSLAQLSPEAQMMSVAYGQALEAEAQRAEVFAGAQPVSLLVKSNEWSANLALALGHEIAGRFDEAQASREAAFESAPDTPGSLDGVAFDWIGDSDHRFGPALEAIIAGKWGLLPFDSLEYIKKRRPKGFARFHMVSSTDWVQNRSVSGRIYTGPLSGYGVVTRHTNRIGAFNDMGRWAYG